MLKPYVEDRDFCLYQGDALEVLRGLPDETVHMCVTSPPYFALRDYGTGRWEGGSADCDHKAPPKGGPHTASTLGPKQDGLGPDNAAWADSKRNHQYANECGKCGARRVDQQLGLEPTPEAYVARMVEVFREVRRVMRLDASLWLNLGDSFLPGKQLAGMPWRMALALQADGWWLRSAITWCKPNAMPESCTDRPSKATEMVFLLTRSPSYYYDAEAIRTEHQRDGRAITAVLGRDGSLQHRDGERWPGSGANAKDWWLIATQPMAEKIRTSRRVRVEPDAPDGGKKRTTSPSCPAHGDLPAPAPMVLGDEHADALLSHSDCSDDHRAQAQLGDSSPIGSPHELDSEPGNSDSPLPECSVVATLHSTGTRRTDRAPATTGPCTPSAETVARIGDTSASPESAAQRRGTSESKPSTADSSAHPSAGIHDHSDCTCAWYVEYTEETSHFAAFPEALVERCVKAGTSERGCCGVCGKPWERETELSAEYRARLVQRQRPEPIGSWLRDHRKAAGLSAKELCAAIGAHGRVNHGGAVSNWEADKNVPTQEQWILLKQVLHLGDEKDSLLSAWHEYERGLWGVTPNALTHGAPSAAPAMAKAARTLGWRPGCDCGGLSEPGTPLSGGSAREDGAPNTSFQASTPGSLSPSPCVVLDPFLGSGTTALVARRLGRKTIGIELSPEYCALAATRLQQLSLFGEALPPQAEQPTLDVDVEVVSTPRLTGGAYSPPGQSPHSNARTKADA